MGQTIAEYLIEKGRQEGRQEGRKMARLHTYRRLLLRLLQNRFGKLPKSLMKRVETTERHRLLLRWFDQASNAGALAELTFTCK